MDSLAASVFIATGTLPTGRPVWLHGHRMT